MTPINMQKFCQRTHRNKDLRTPFMHLGWRYATDQKIVIRMPDPTANPTHPVGPKVAALFEKTPGLKWQVLPPFQLGKTCRTCDGEGEYLQLRCASCAGEGMFLHHSYNYVCIPCSGYGWRGNTTDPKAELYDCPDCMLGTSCVEVRINDAWFDSRYLALIRNLPNLLIQTNGPKGRMDFTFDGGQGILMPIAK